MRWPAVAVPEQEQEAVAREHGGRAERGRDRSRLERGKGAVEQARAAFEEAISLPEIGIIIISEEAAALIRETVNRYIFTREFPLIVEIPGSRGRNPDRPGLRQMVNEAIGINL